MSYKSIDMTWYKIRKKIFVKNGQILFKCFKVNVITKALRLHEKQIQIEKN